MLLRTESECFICIVWSEYLKKQCSTVRVSCCKFCQKVISQAVTTYRSVCRGMNMKFARTLCLVVRLLLLLLLFLLLLLPYELHSLVLQEDCELCVGQEAGESDLGQF